MKFLNVFLVLALASLSLAAPITKDANGKIVNEDDKIVISNIDEPKPLLR